MNTLGRCSRTCLLSPAELRSYFHQAVVFLDDSHEIACGKADDPWVLVVWHCLPSVTSSAVPAHAPTMYGYLARSSRATATYVDRVCGLCGFTQAPSAP